MKKTKKTSPIHPKLGSALSKEMTRLGSQLGTAMKSAAQSQKVKAIQSDITSSVRSLGNNLSKALETARTSEETRQLKSQVGKVFKAGRKEGTEAARVMRENVASSMKFLSKELSTLADKLKKSS
ncbi:MAG: hypothetical protein WC728_00885 [Elusimicrobiota bacterium]